MRDFYVLWNLGGGGAGGNRDNSGLELLPHIISREVGIIEGG